MTGLEVEQLLCGSLPPVLFSKGGTGDGDGTSVRAGKSVTAGDGEGFGGQAGGDLSF